MTHYIPPSVAEIGLKKHCKNLGVDYKLLSTGFDTGLSDAAIAKLVGKSRHTITKWRPVYFAEHEKALPKAED